MPQPQRIVLLAVAALALTTTSGVPPALTPLAPTPPEPATLPDRHPVQHVGLALSIQMPSHPRTAHADTHVADRAALPGWRQLERAADAGDPRAACELSLLLDDCRMASAIGGMVETQVSMAAVSGISPIIAAAEIAALEASAEALRPQCAGVPDVLLERGWSHLLAAAVAGHEASIHRFLTDPPVQPESGEDYRLARQRYRENAALLLGDLLQRNSPGAMALAFRVAQGEVFFADLELLPPDPAAVVRLGTALQILRDDANREAVIERALEQLPARAARRARAEGRALALRLVPISTAGSHAELAGIAECAEGWPGSRSHHTAYSF